MGTRNRVGIGLSYRPVGLCSLTGCYDKPMPGLVPSPIDCSKIPAQCTGRIFWDDFPSPCFLYGGGEGRGRPMDQISIKTPNPKCRFSSKLTSKGTWRQVFICLRPSIPFSPFYKLYEYMYPCTGWIHTPVLINTGKGEGGVCKPVRRLEGR